MRKITRVNSHHVLLGMLALSFVGCEVPVPADTIYSVPKGAETCEPGFADCDGQIDNGCEANLATDETNCGTCGHFCAPLETCDAGQCVCNESNCFCANLENDPQNCGACGISVDDGDPCTNDACWNGVPTHSIASKWTLCLEDGQCDGQGVCKTRIGKPCTTNDACWGGFCVDGVCCENACDGACQACTSVKTGRDDGYCKPILYLEDPEEECPNGACNGSGQCTDPGTACTNASDCATGYCVDGVCCDSPCTETCMTCNRADHVGTCTSTPLFDNDANGMPSCSGPAGSCNGNSVCKAEAGQLCTMNADCLSGHCENGTCGTAVLQIGPLVWQWHEDTSVVPLMNDICGDTPYQPFEYPQLKLSAMVVRADGSIMGTGTHLHPIFGMPSEALTFCVQIREDHRGPHPFVFEVDSSGQLTRREQVDRTSWSMDYSNIPHCYGWCSSHRRTVTGPLLALAGGDVVSFRQRDLDDKWTNKDWTETVVTKCDFGELFKSALPQWSLGTSEVCAHAVIQMTGDSLGNVFVRNGLGITKFDAAGQIVQTLPDPFNGAGMYFNAEENALVIGPQGEFHLDLRAGTGIFLGKANAAGVLEWSKTVPDSWNKELSVSHAVDAAGNTLLAFNSTSIIDLGNGPIPRLGPQDLVLAKLDPQGNVLWSKRFGGPTFGARRISMRGTGTDAMAILLGFTGMVDLGDGVLQSSPVLMKLDASGAIVWHVDLTTHFSFPVSEEQWVLSGHSSGAVFVSGWGYAPNPPGNPADWNGIPRDLRFVVAKYGP